MQMYLGLIYLSGSDNNIKYSKHLKLLVLGRETDNKFDNLLIYGTYGDSELYNELVSMDTYYGASAYEPFLRDYWRVRERI